VTTAARTLLDVAARWEPLLPAALREARVRRLVTNEELARVLERGPRPGVRALRPAHRVVHQLRLQLSS